MKGSLAASISTPISPLATMIPSLASMISSILSIPSWFSIFEITWMFACFSARISLIWRTASPFLIKDAAINSNPLSQANFISSISFCVSAGSFIETPGTLTPFFSPSSPPFKTLVWISGPSTFITSSAIRPSSISILSPAFTSSLSPL